MKRGEEQYPEEEEMDKKKHEGGTKNVKNQDIAPSMNA